MKIFINILLIISCFCYNGTFAENINTSFTLKSINLGGQITNKYVFNGFGCSGENISPDLFWENAPEGTLSYAITMYDPDAPTGSGWWHWVIFDIPKYATGLKEGAGKVKPSQPFIQSNTDFGTQGYGGACPPIGHGMHRYIITVYALKKEKLGLDKNASPALVGFYLWNNTIAKSSIISYFQR